MSSIWGFFTEVSVPGTDISIAVIFAGLLFISIGFGLLSLVAGFPVGTGSQSYRSSGSRKVKISDARKHDDE